MKKIAFYTLGCRANQYQTFSLKCQMTNDQCQMVDFTQTADIYVINTCTVTEDADRKSRQAIRRALRQNPKATVIVTGCYARLEAKALKKHFPQIEIIDANPFVPPSGRPRPEGHRSEGGPSGRGHPSPLVPRVRANLMIQDGCEHFCSYCIVPYARGKIKCKPQEQVIEEAKQLVEAGAREIVLTGINLGTYQDLSSLIRRLSSIEGLLRIRLSSLEPMYLNKDLIDCISETPKACHHLHISLQSGDNCILKAMRREYTRDDFLELVNYARKKIPDCGITTDIIVGFPGEGEKEFQNTVDLVSQVKFSRLHIFPYSKRQGTPAADFPNQVDVKTKKQRSKILLELGITLMNAFAKQYLTKEVEILVEKQGEGKTSNFIHCWFDDPNNSTGKLIKRGPASLKYPCFL